MFARSSRYANLPTLVGTDDNGASVAYKGRRLCPGADAPGNGAATVIVAAATRLDLIAAQQLGDPTLFWKIADVNGALDPFTLTATPGRLLFVPRS